MTPPGDLIITVGIPGCGKTTEAVKYVAKAPATRIRVNRDDLRTMGHGGWLGLVDQEDQITVLQLEAVRALLRAGITVVVDDTNLYPDSRARLFGIALSLGAQFEVWDFTEMPLEIALERNAGREGPARLDDEVIRSKYRTWVTEPAQRGEDPLRDVRPYITLPAHGVWAPSGS